MITKANYFDKVNEIDYNSLPEALKEGYDTIKFGSKDYTTWEYLEDDPEFLDLYFDKLNKFLSKDSNTQKEKTAIDTKKSSERKKKLPKEKAEKKPIKESASEATKPKLVEMIPAEIGFIRRYVNLHGKVVSRKRLLSFLTSLQKAMLEKRIRKTSPYAPQMMTIQDQLINVIKKMEDQVEINISEKNLAKYKEIASSERIRESIALLKRFLSIHGREGMEEKASMLKAAMEKKVKQRKITKEDPYAERLQAAYSSLASFLKDKKPVPQITEEALAGIISLVNQKESIPVKKSNRSVLSSQELLQMRFETIHLQGQFRELIGDPSVGFTAMVFGQPKSGKSTLMLEFANELAQNHGKVLYAAIEEGYGYTLKEKIQRVGATSSRLEFSEKLPANLSDYDFVFVDSVSRAGMELEDMIKLKNSYPRTGFIFIFHSTKDGKFRGGNDLAHEVDVIIEVEPGLAKASGRFNAGGEMGF